MASAPNILDQTYVPQSSAEKGEPSPKSPLISPRSAPSSQPSSPKQEPLKPFGQMSSREQARWLWGSRRKTRSKKSRKQRRKTLKRRAK